MYFRQLSQAGMKHCNLGL